MTDEEDEVPPLDPKKVALFVILVGMVGFAGWRFWRAQKAVAAVAEASKDYRKLFPTRSSAPPPAAAAPAATGAPTSGMMLQVDDDMRVPKPAAPPLNTPEAPPEAPPEAEAKTAIAVKEDMAAPAKPAPKAYTRPKLNSGAFSGLNGGSGVGFSEKK